jgi:hypothetical protein
MIDLQTKFHLPSSKEPLVINDKAKDKIFHGHCFIAVYKH